VDLTIHNSQSALRGKFYIGEPGHEVAEMLYTLWGPEKMIITHTQVESDHEGQGLGSKLVEAGVEYARSHSLKIEPQCAFAKRLFDHTPAYADVRFSN